MMATIGQLVRMTMRKVVQFSTGNVGRHSLRAIIGRKDLQLVGVHAANPDKIGRDATELCGLDEPTGVIATDDIDALIALEPDCVVYTAQGETRPIEAIEQMSKFLSSGINVVATVYGDTGTLCKRCAIARWDELTDAEKLDMLGFDYL